jgi:hypothetical protein
VKQVFADLGPSRTLGSAFFVLLEFIDPRRKDQERRLRVFENWVLRKIFGPKRDEVRGEWRKLHNEELHDLYSSPNIVPVIKSRRMRWAVHVARMGEACTGFWWGNVNERDHWGDPGVDARIILRRIFRKSDLGVWTGFGWLRIGTVAGT